MKRIFLLSLVMSGNFAAFSQDELKSIDENLKQIKDEIVKGKPDSYSGQSLFEDQKGSSAIFLPYGGTFRLNTADASLKLSFVNSVSTRKFFYGFDISGKTNDGLVPLISKGDIAPGSQVNGVIGLKELFGKSDLLDAWVALKIGYEGASFKVFDPDSSFSGQISKKSFNTFTTSLSYNMKIGGDKIVAASIGYQKASNYDDLDDLELTDEKKVVDSASGTTRIYQKKTKVKVGDYKTFDQIPLNVDFFWVPADIKRIGFYHYWRGKFTDGAFTNGFGSGLYLLKKNNPLSSIAGMVFEIPDVSKLKDGFGKNFTVSFVVGFNFGFAKSN